MRYAWHPDDTVDTYPTRGDATSRCGQSQRMMNHTGWWVLARRGRDSETPDVYDPAMPHTTLINTHELNERLENPDWAVIDCRFSLDAPQRGRNDYLENHIAGAVYAHLNEDLSAPVVPGRTGRHPLPDIDAFAETLSRWGVDSEVQVVAYDDAGGAIAARLWWMLRWLGHDAVAVLDGGWQKWLEENRPVRLGQEQRPPRSFEPRPRRGLLIATADILRHLGDRDWEIVDSRIAERYRG